jgi:competence protein ComEC
MPGLPIRARLRHLLHALRIQAALHRGAWIAAPVFWAAFAVFLNPIWGCAGFLVQALFKLPRRRFASILLLVSWPVMALWFAARAPYLSLGTHRLAIPFHREYAHTDPHPRTYAGRVENLPVPSARGYVFLFRASDGDRLIYRVNLETPPPQWGANIALNPGQLDMRRVLRGQGAAAVLEADGWEENRAPPVWKRALVRMRASLSASLNRNVPQVALPLLEASLLNITENVPDETREAFQRSGMQHILAISGQHIGLLLAFLLFIGLSVRLPRKAAFMLAALATAAYIPLVGAPVSVVRSGIQLAFLLPAILLERRAAALHALCLTVATDLLLDPHNILNLGFQLSYTATLALLLGSRPAHRMATHALDWFARMRAHDSEDADKPKPSPMGWLHGTLQMVVLSTLISLFTYPILAASTHATTPWGVLGNALTVPIGAAMLVGGLCTWSFDFFAQIFSHLILTISGTESPLITVVADALNLPVQWAGAATGFCALLLEGTVFLLAEMPGALRPIADSSAMWIAVLCAGCGITVLLLRKDRVLLALLCAGILLAAESVRPRFARIWDIGRDGVRLTFLAVGHGDAAVLELPGAVILIDAGDAPRIARNIIIPFLQQRGIGRVDLMILTHPDRDHYGGAAALIDRIPVGSVLGPPEPEEASPTWNCLRAEARAHHVPWREGRAGQRVYSRNRVSLQILGPGEALADVDKNDRSVVALLHTGRERVFFTGDIEQPGQEALATTWPLWRGAWLKAPHHGSDRTTAPCFLLAAHPPRTVISCGSRRGFPGKNTVATLEAISSRIAVTKQDGAVTWKFGRQNTTETRHLNSGHGSAN